MGQNGDFLEADGRQLEYLWMAAEQKLALTPTLVFLHEGLGCVTLWKGFPDRVATTTGVASLVYSRAGYGASDPRKLPWPVTYMHHEAQVVLPQVLQTLNLDDVILFGHSDGASIALIHAASAAGGLRMRGLVLLAPHVFTEEVALQSIRSAGQSYLKSNLRRRLARHHKHVDNAFWGWHDAWLLPEFKNWNLERLLPAIQCPILLIQGEDDVYGTQRQLESIATHVSAPVEQVLLHKCGHSPHLDRPEATHEAVTQFIQRCCQAGQRTAGLK